MIIIYGIGSVILSVAVLLVTGNADMPYRTYCFNYAIFILSTLLYFGCSFQLNNKIKICLEIGLLFLIVTQSKEMEQIYYDKYLTTEQDKKLAGQIMTELERECGTIATYNKPIIFMGFPNNQICSYGEVEKTSLFLWDRISGTASEEASIRIFRYLEMLGYQINNNVSDVNFKEVREITAEMSSFPEKNSIYEAEEYIIVKLGDSLLEILDNNKVWEQDLNLIGNIENFTYDKRNLYITGWLILKGENAFSSNISLILKNNTNSYRLRLDEYVRKDVTSYFADGFNYDNSGISANITIPDGVEKGNYQVYLELKDKEEK